MRSKYVTFRSPVTSVDSSSSQEGTPGNYACLVSIIAPLLEHCEPWWTSCRQNGQAWSLGFEWMIKWGNPVGDTPVVFLTVEFLTLAMSVQFLSFYHIPCSKLLCQSPLFLQWSFTSVLVHQGFFTETQNDCPCVYPQWQKVLMPGLCFWACCIQIKQL